MEHRLVGGSEEAEALRREENKEECDDEDESFSLFRIKRRRICVTLFSTFSHLLNRLSPSPLHLSLPSSSSLSSRQEFHSHLSQGRKRVFSPHHHLSNSFLFPPPLFPLLFSSFHSDTASGTLSSLWNAFRQFSRFFDQRHHERNCYVCTLLPASLCFLSPTSYPEQGWWLRKRKAEHPSSLLHLSRVFFLTIIIPLSSPSGLLIQTPRGEERNNEEINERWGRKRQGRRKKGKWWRQQTERDVRERWGQMKTCCSLSLFSLLYLFIFSAKRTAQISAGRQQQQLIGKWEKEEEDRWW